METLFSNIERYQRKTNAPLAVRMRPQTLDGFVGQEQAVGEGSWLRRAIERDALSSVILYGPAGTGKTTLARIIANTTHAEFVEVSAVTGTAAAPSSSWTRFTASTDLSRMRCSMRWRTGWWSLLAPPPRTRTSRSTPR